MARRTKQTTKTHDPEREITARIIAAIEAGTAPWRKPWTGARHRLGSSSTFR